MDMVGKTLGVPRYVLLAKQDAVDILNAHKGDATPEMKQMATDYIAGKIEVEDFMTGIGKQSADHKEQKSTDDFLSGLGQKSKKSMMRPTLTDDFGEQEGRAMTNDTVTDTQKLAMERSQGYTHLC
jgi:hypothetical protein